jgi:23S rRNA pseudouridine1911/1915/1917 synthase
MARVGNKPPPHRQAPRPAGTHEAATAPGPLVVIYEDNHLLGVVKPAGMPTQAGRPGEPCLLEVARQWVRERYDKPGNVFLGLVHRLDRPVAGVVVLARTSKAASRLSAQLRARTVTKIYRALVSGRPAPAEATLVHHVQTQPDGRVVLHDRPAQGRKEARLRYRVLRAGSPSLLEVRLETGRKHQIRMQLARHGHPIVGDARYGSTVPFTPAAIGLVAWRLVVTHPTQPERRVELTMPDALLPASMRVAGE